MAVKRGISLDGDFAPDQVVPLTLRDRAREALRIFQEHHPLTQPVCVLLGTQEFAEMVEILTEAGITRPAERIVAGQATLAGLKVRVQGHHVSMMEVV